MQKVIVKTLAAILLVGASFGQAQASIPLDTSDISVGAVSIDAPGTLTVAHSSKWSHYHKCTPSPCKKLKYRHKKGHGWGSKPVEPAGPRFKAKKS